jgi:hypothetical protein
MGSDWSVDFWIRMAGRSHGLETHIASLHGESSSITFVSQAQNYFCPAQELYEEIYSGVYVDTSCGEDCDDDALYWDPLSEPKSCSYPYEGGELRIDLLNNGADSMNPPVLIDVFAFDDVYTGQGVSLLGVVSETCEGMTADGVNDTYDCVIFDSFTAETDDVEYKVEASNFASLIGTYNLAVDIRVDSELDALDTEDIAVLAVELYTSAGSAVTITGTDLLADFIDGEWHSISLSFEVASNDYTSCVVSVLHDTQVFYGTVNVTGLSLDFEYAPTSSFIAPALPIGEWVHVAASYDSTANGGELSVYYNSLLQRNLISSPSSFAAPTDDSMQLQVGGSGSTGIAWELEATAMQVDDFRIHSRTLSANAVTAAWRQEIDADAAEVEVALQFEDLPAISPLDSIGACEGEIGVDYMGYNLASVSSVTDAAECCDMCANYFGCMLWSYDTNSQDCELKEFDAFENRVESDYITSGKRPTAERTITDEYCVDIDDCFTCMSAVDARPEFEGEECVPVVGDSIVCMATTESMAYQAETDSQCVSKVNGVSQVLDIPVSRWVRVFRETMLETVMSSEYMQNDPDREAFSDLALIEEGRMTDRKYMLKLSYPDREGSPANVWKQTTNPATRSDIENYEAISIGVSDNFWGLASCGALLCSNPSDDTNAQRVGNSTETVELYVAFAVDGDASASSTTDSSSNALQVNVTNVKNSISGEIDQIYYGATMNGPEDQRMLFKPHNNASNVGIGYTGATATLSSFRDTHSVVGPADTCPRYGCPATGEYEPFVNPSIFYWSDDAAWQQNNYHHGVPVEGEDITIPGAWHVIIDVETADLASISVKGILEFWDPTPNCTARGNGTDVCDADNKYDCELMAECEWFTAKPVLNTHVLNVYGGSVIAGNATKPYENDATINMGGKDGAVEYVDETGATALLDIDTTGEQVINVHGDLHLYGKQTVSTWLYLGNNSYAGDTSITLETPVDWLVGDDILLANGNSPSMSCRDKTFEIRTITDISSDGYVVSFEEPLEYNRVGEIQTLLSEFDSNYTRDLDIRVAVGLLSRNVRIVSANQTSGMGRAYGVTMVVGPTELDNSHVTGRTRDWYIEGRGFFRYAHASVKLNYIEIVRWGKRNVEPLFTETTMVMCEGETRDPGCPVKTDYKADAFEIIGCSFRGGIAGDTGEVGPIDGLEGYSPHIWKDNVAHTMFAWKYEGITSGEYIHNMGVDQDVKEFDIMQPQGIFNFLEATEDAIIQDNYAAGSTNFGFYFAGKEGRNANRNVATCSMAGFSYQSEAEIYEDVAWGNEVGAYYNYKSNAYIDGFIAVANDLGMQFSADSKCELTQRVSVMHHYENTGQGDIAKVYTSRGIRNVLVLGNLYPNEISASLEAQGTRVGFHAARFDTSDTTFGRMGANSATAMITTLGDFPGGCYPARFEKTTFLDEDSRVQTKMKYKESDDLLGYTYCGNYRCDFWSRCYVEDLDGTLTYGASSDGEQVTFLPDMQEWWPTVKASCQSAGDAESQSACYWWMKDQPRIMDVAVWDENAQGIIRDNDGYDWNADQCTSDTDLTTNGILCGSGMKYVDVWLQDLFEGGSNAERVVGPLGVTVEGDQLSLFEDDEGPFSTDILNGLADPEGSDSQTGVQNIFRAVLQDQMRYRLDFTGTAPEDMSITAPWIKTGQSVVIRIYLSTSFIVNIQDQNGDTMFEEAYKDTVYPGRPHGTWFYDRISKLLHVVVSDSTPLYMVQTEMIKVSLTVAVTVDQFFEDDTFVEYMASVLLINPERVKTTDVVPGQGQRRLLSEDDEFNYAAENTSDVDFTIQAPDLCQDVTCYNYGICISGSCVCQLGSSGDECEIVSELGTFYVTDPANENRTILNLNYTNATTMLFTTAMFTTMPATTTALSEDDDGWQSVVLLDFDSAAGNGTMDVGYPVDTNSVVTTVIKQPVFNVSAGEGPDDDPNAETTADVTYVAPVYICGNGVRTTDEQCDDGNDDLNDGCSNCTIDFGFECTINYIGHTSYCNIIDNCQFGYCENGATCTNSLGNYTCDCTEGFEGRNCSVDIDECEINTHSCHANAACINAHGNYTCECNAGFTGDGETCADIDECATGFIGEGEDTCLRGKTCSTPVVNDYSCDCGAAFYGKRCGSEEDLCAANSGLGTCNAATTVDCETNCASISECNMQCNCLDGYEGADCSINIDECASDPCMNGGACNDLVNDYSCDCTDTGFEGDVCEINIDDCLGVDCGTGTCVDGVTNYTCDCDAFYSGDHCETDIDECSLSGPEGFPCHVYFGDCTNTEGGYECVCKPGYEGEGIYDGIICSEIDECASDPCQNGGNCTDAFMNYTCACDSGWEGYDCDIDIDECDMETDACHADASCLNQDGTYECECNAGYEGDGFACVEIDECAVLLPCQNGGVCTDLVNSYQCTCPANFTGSDCENDVDECQSSPCHTDANCNNTFGSFECTCDAGYEGDGLSCTDIDDCASDPCYGGATCSDELLGYTCTCDEVTFTGENCNEDVNECLNTISFDCPNNSTCENAYGGYQCNCDEGFNNSTDDDRCESFDECGSSPCLNGGNCADGHLSYICDCPNNWQGSTCDTDVDECADDTLYECVAHSTCNNLDGAYECICDAGFEMENGVCEEIDDCVSSPCHNGASCADEHLGFTCTCTSAWTGDTCEEDVNECATSYLYDCMENAFCNNTAGAYECLCDAGFEMVGSSCVEIDECASAPCVNDGTCDDALLSYSCSCTSAWTGSTCEDDVDECADALLYSCVDHSTCNNTVGSYDCLCDAGYEWDNGECVNIDDCASSPCYGTATCVDGIMSYDCLCDETIFTGFDCATDVDECIQNVFDCPSNATCENAYGGYQCDCDDGYVDSTDDERCESFDECGSDPCMNGGNCTDGHLSFTCSCPLAWTGANCEEDVDECTDSTMFSCIDNSYCSNIVGSYECICDDGYEMVNGTCESIDECGSDPCMNGGSCTDDHLSFMCSCPLAWTGANCEEDVDECSNSEMFPCTDNSFCNNIVGSYECICDDGYQMVNGTCENIDDCMSDSCLNGGNCSDIVSGFVCYCPDTYSGITCEEDIDECALSMDTCVVNSQCINTDGSYTCPCDEGFEGDGFVECEYNPFNDLQVQAEQEEQTLYLTIGAVVGGVVVIVIIIIVVVLVKKKSSKRQLIMPLGATENVDLEASPTKPKPRRERNRAKQLVPENTDEPHETNTSTVSTDIDDDNTKSSLTEEGPATKSKLAALREEATGTINEKEENVVTAINEKEENAVTAMDADGFTMAIGSRVMCDGFKYGIVKYIGALDELPTDDVYVGVLLDEPDGSCDGSVISGGKRYFTCEPLHGIFSRPNFVTLESAHK